MSNTITQSVQNCIMTLEAEIPARNEIAMTIPPIDQIAYQEVTDKTIELVDKMKEYLNQVGDSPDDGLLSPPPMP